MSFFGKFSGSNNEDNKQNLDLEKEFKEFVENPSVDAREKIADKISQSFSENIFNETEERIAKEVIRLLAKDTELRIRKTLANNLKRCERIPKDVALNLAHDLADEVATPILENSVVITQEELVQIVKGTKRIACLIAIARRPDISQVLSASLIDTNNEDIVNHLINNKLADISEDSLQKAIEQFAQSGVIMEALVERGGLSPTIIERMMTSITSELKDKLVSKYNIDIDLAEGITAKTQEQNILNLISSAEDRKKTEEMVRHLNNKKMLTSTIMLRAICKGDLVFFEIGLAILSGIPVSTAHDIIFKESARSFAELYKKANMPRGSFDAVNVIVRFAIEDLENGLIYNTNYAKRMIERIIEGEYDQKVNMMKYFMELIKSNPSSSTKMGSG